MGFGKSAKKYYMKAKKKAYGSRGVKGRYYRVRATQGLHNLAKGIDMMKSRLNVEKKNKNADVVTSSIGQANHNADGIRVWDVTPSIANGTLGNERVGNSLKLTGMSLPLQFTQQVSCFGDRKVRCTLLKVLSADNGVSGTEAVEDFWDTNPLTGLRDFHAPRAYRNAGTDGIKAIRSVTIHVPAVKTDNATSGTVDNTEVNPKNYIFNVKLQDLLRYSSSSSATPDGVRYYFVIQVDSGNYSASNSTSLDIPITTNSTGLVARIAQRAWYVDN